MATSILSNQCLLARHPAMCNAHGSRGSRGLVRLSVVGNSLSSKWKSRSDFGEHWKGAPPFVSRQCFPNTLLVREVVGEITVRYQRIIEYKSYSTAFNEIRFHQEK